ncbi:hypothetical protein BFP76_12630 [Amylibacter kogurei]|uniref:DUF2269 domain-containing protein n=1 Tax=Paramylibacter kogurei TaxID=1889778 RepID=A0A2G5K9X7_9RHOB|nr:DUF2269 domain-containing protein [Amylibacter kogurei]PIB25842.1 hypothetical protein BFP76_12630 [Amylibacter kogurei]
MDYAMILRFIHVLGAITLMGTGAGIAFFMLMAHRTHDAKLIAHTAAIVVIADTIFTATAAIVQPISGYLLAKETGWFLNEGWLLLSIFLYIFVGIFWLPVVWIQIQLRNFARESVYKNIGLTHEYYRLFRLWFIAGFPAFGAMLVIIWLMLVRPDLQLF